MSSYAHLTLVYWIEPTAKYIRYLPVMISRIVLSLREAADSQRDEGLSLGAQTITGINFQSAGFVLRFSEELQMGGEVEGPVESDMLP